MTRERGVIFVTLTAVGVMFVVLLIMLRVFVIEPYRIPSGAMMPTLLPGDFIVVYKLPYGRYGTHGFTFPISFIRHPPERGDVIVFALPSDPSVSYIKRVIGLPGESLAIKGEDVAIGDQWLVREPMGDFAYDFGERTSNFLRVRENFAKRHYELLFASRNSEHERTYRVLPNSYFVLGDNRDFSNDSRYWGSVPEQNIVGKAVLIWFSVDSKGNIR